MKSFRLLVLAAALVLSYAVVAAAAPACNKKIESFDFVVDYSGSMMMKNAQLKQDKIVVAKNVLQRVNAAIPALSYNGGLHTISPNGTIVAQGHVCGHQQAAQRLPDLRPYDQHGQRPAGL